MNVPEQLKEKPTTALVSVVSICTPPRISCSVSPSSAGSSTHAPTSSVERKSHKGRGYEEGIPARRARRGPSDGAHAGRHTRVGPIHLRRPSSASRATDHARG